MDVNNISKQFTPIYYEVDKWFTMEVILSLFGITTIIMMLSVLLNNVVFTFIVFLMMAFLYFLVFQKKRVYRDVCLSHLLVLGTMAVALSVLFFLLMISFISSTSILAMVLFWFVFIIEAALTVISGYFLFFLAVTKKTDTQTLTTRILCLVLVLLPLLLTINNGMSIVYYYFLIVGAILAMFGSNEGRRALGDNYTILVLTSFLAIIIILIIWLSIMKLNTRVIV